MEIEKKINLFLFRTHAIYVFSSDGKFQNRIGKIGQGVNEIVQFLDYTTNGKFVYVADFGNKFSLFRIST